MGGAGAVIVTLMSILELLFGYTNYTVWVSILVITPFNANTNTRSSS